MSTSSPVSTGIIAISVIAASALLGYSIYQSTNLFRQMDRRVSAKGLVERIEKADRATLNFTFTLKSANRADLYAQLIPLKKQLVAHFTKLGFEEKNLTMQSPNVRDLTTEYNNQNTTKAHAEPFVMSVVFTLSTRNVDLAQETQSKAFDLTADNIPITDASVVYHLERFPSMRAGLIEEATRNAREVAEGFSKTTGSKIGGIRNATQGPIQILSPDALPTDTWSNEASSMMKKIRLVSTIDFYIKD